MAGSLNLKDSLNLDGPTQGSLQNPEDQLVFQVYT